MSEECHECATRLTKKLLDARLPVPVLDEAKNTLLGGMVILLGTGMRAKEDMEWMFLTMRGVQGCEVEEGMGDILRGKVEE